MNDADEEKVIRPGNTSDFLFAASSFFLVLSLVLPWVLEGNKVVDFPEINWWWVAFPGVLSLISGGAVVRGVPKLMMSSEGSRYSSLIAEKSWNWENLGPFSLDVRLIRFTTVYTACAFTSPRSKPWHKSGISSGPSAGNADVRVPLKLLEDCRDRESAQEIVDTLKRTQNNLADHLSDRISANRQVSSSSSRRREAEIRYCGC